MGKADYNGPQQLVDNFLRFNFDKDCKILDVLGGTGVLAKMVSSFLNFNLDERIGNEKSEELLSNLAF